MNKETKVIIGVIIIFLFALSAMAEMSLPGEPLYAVKTNFNEPLAGIFAISAQDKIKWQQQLAARRLEEKQQLGEIAGIETQTTKDTPEPSTTQVTANDNSTPVEPINTSNASSPDTKPVTASPVVKKVPVKKTPPKHIVPRDDDDDYEIDD